jgi:hypothetical protein
MNDDYSELNNFFREKSCILIAGDSVVDEFFFSESSQNTAINIFGIPQHYHSESYLGGVHQIGQFLTKLLASESQIQFHVIYGDKEFATREILKKYKLPSEKKSSEFVFRGEKFLGVSERDARLHYQLSESELKEKAIWSEQPKNNIGLFIFNDVGQNFKTNEENCKKLLSSYKNNPDSWVIAKINPPFQFEDTGYYCNSFQGFLKEVKNKLIITVHLSDLRLISGVNISYRLSWEKTTEELLYQLNNNPKLRDLLHCKILIIRIGLEGALVLKDPDQIEKNGAELFFDPFLYEDNFCEDFEGNIQGISTAFFAGLIKELISNNGLKSGIQMGLNLGRKMWECGYGSDNIPQRIPKQLTTAINKPIEISSVIIHLSDRKNWTILLKNFNKPSFTDIAYTIVEEGVDSLYPTTFPIFQVGELLTVDRREIESFRSVKNIIIEYINSENYKKPLSIAVFGPPGSGKSFGIKEILKSIKKANFKYISFNLSQFTDIKQLTSAFHKIRDQSLYGKVPLVFFDEFDSNFENSELGWIKYFLAPMQDGTFFDGEVSHPLGRCIFVFAGGVFSDYRSFVDRCKMEDKTKDMKIKDFISRLRGFIDITRCNPDPELPDDELYKIKRAILLRSILVDKVPQLVDSDKKIAIDRDVLRAFIKISEYKHGVRSMQAIIEMSNLKNKQKFEPSALPADNQLNLHVNAEQFSNLLLRSIHFNESTDIICRSISKSHNKAITIFGSNYKNEDIRKYVQNIPKYLEDLKFGFKRSKLSPLNIKNPKLTESSQYSVVVHNYRSSFSNISKFFDIIPEILAEAGFEIYKI